jgi:hypothetical protein
MNQHEIDPRFAAPGRRRQRSALAARLAVAALALAAATPALANGPNLLANPNFDSGFAGWTGNPQAVVSWSASDASAAVGSGSVRIGNTYPGASGMGLTQCVPVAPNTQYVVRSSTWVPSGSPADSSGGSWVFWYPSANCEGTLISFLAYRVFPQGEWRFAANTGKSPASAQSAKVLLLSGKDGGNGATVSFDNAYFGTGGCAPGATRLCLGGGRFAVTATWKTTNGATGSGSAVPFGADSGSFWFFGPTNIEMDVKVLDACGLNGRFWVFAAGLTNVEVVLTVTDTKTGAVKTYTNPQGHVFATITDTGAFATCP